MDNFGINHVLIILGIILMASEVILGAITGFELLLIGVILIISGVLGLVTTSVPTALVAIVILSLAYVAFGRKFLRQKLSVTTHYTNVDALIGKSGIIVKSIKKNHPGQMKIDGELWRAESEDDIKVGNRVVIQSATGVTLKVSRS